MKIEKVEQFTYTDEQIVELENLCKAKMSHNGHALISPSGVYRWGRCLGSLTGIHESRAKNPDSVASVEGTTAHYILELALITGQAPSKHTPETVTTHQAYVSDIGRWVARINKNASNTPDVIATAQGFKLQLLSANYDHEFIKHLEPVYNAIIEYQSKGYTVYPEKRVKLRAVLMHSQCDGMSDVILYNPQTKHLIIADLKYGSGHNVPTENNPQLSLYGVGAKQYIESRYGLDSVYSVSLAINQPRINSRYFDIWEAPDNYLLDFARYMKELSSRALFAIAYPERITPAHYAPSELSCNYCHRKTACEPRSAKLKELVYKVFAASDVGSEGSLLPKNAPRKDVKLIDNDFLSDVLSAAPFITACIKDYQEEATRRVLKGADIGGRKVVRGRKVRAWSVPPAELITFCEDLGLKEDSIFIKKPRSVAQMEKLKLSDDQRDAFNKLVQIKHGKPRVVLGNDPRQSIKEENRQAVVNKLR